MKQLNFDTGIVEYALNDKCTISFNPTDSFFVERLFNTFDELDKKQEGYKAEVDGMDDKREVFTIARKRDLEMREMVNGVFDEDVCDAVFGGMCVYAMADGLPVWCNLLLAVMDEVDTTFAREQKATNPRVKKYTEKYKKYQK